MDWHLKICYQLKETFWLTPSILRHGWIDNWENDVNRKGRQHWWYQFHATSLLMVEMSRMKQNWFRLCFGLIMSILTHKLTDTSIYAFIDQLYRLSINIVDSKKDVHFFLSKQCQFCPHLHVIIDISSAPNLWIKTLNYQGLILIKGTLRRFDYHRH